jgi:hypothetical protein
MELIVTPEVILGDEERSIIAQTISSFRLFAKEGDGKYALIKSYESRLGENNPRLMFRHAKDLIDLVRFMQPLLREDCDAWADKASGADIVSSGLIYRPKQAFETLAFARLQQLEACDQALDVLGEAVALMSECREEYEEGERC